MTLFEGNQTLQFKEKRKYITNLCSLQDGGLLSVRSMKVTEWNPSTGQAKMTVKFHKAYESDGIRSICQQENGLVAIAVNNAVMRYNFGNQKSHLFLKLPLWTHNNALLCPLSNGNLATAFDDRTGIWSRKGKEIITFRNRRKQVASMLQLNNGFLATGFAGNGLIKLWDLEKQECVMDLDNNPAINLRLCQLQDGTFVAGCDSDVLRMEIDERILLWDIRTPKKYFDKFCRENINSLCQLHDGRLLTSDDTGKLKIWNLRGRKVYCEKIIDLDCSKLCQLMDGTMAVTQYDEYTNNSKICILE